MVHMCTTECKGMLRVIGAILGDTEQVYESDRAYVCRHGEANPLHLSGIRPRFDTRM